MLICGLDEAGRGPLAGPVTAAAVILPDTFPADVLRDSKRLSARRREHIDAIIRAESVAWGIGWASHAEIDDLNILRASHLAMRRALAQLGAAPDKAIVDGSVLPDLGVPAEAVVKADATIPCVMAASILAKVARDRWMDAYARLEPRYAFSSHKGYPTPKHRELLERYGPSPVHRLSFAPCRAVRTATRAPE
ncbi:MAG: ribonuclease HII [Spirochaetota bacterium]